MSDRFFRVWFTTCAVLAVSMIALIVFVWQVVR